MKFLEILYSPYIIIGVIGLIIIFFTLYAFDITQTELMDRKLHSLLYNKIDVDGFLEEISMLIVKTKNPQKQVRYSILKALGLYYKDDIGNAFEWLKNVSNKVETSDDNDLKMLYNAVVFRILLRLGYNENTENVYQSKKDIIEKMSNNLERKFDSLYIKGVYEREKKNFQESYDILQEAKKAAINRLDKTMCSYQLSKTCLHLDRLEEAEAEVEEVMKSRKKSKNTLYIYDELEKIIRKQRESSNTISSIDKDLEEQNRQEALDKMNKEVENAVEEDIENKEKKVLEKNSNIQNDTASNKNNGIDADVAKLKEEEAFNEQLKQMTNALNEEMLVQNNLNK